MATGTHELAGFFWSGTGSGEGRVYGGANQRNLRPEWFTIDRMQRISIRTTSDIECSGSTGYCDALKSRSAVLRRFSNDKITDLARDGGMELFQRYMVSLKPFTMQIWGHNTPTLKTYRLSPDPPLIVPTRLDPCLLNANKDVYGVLRPEVLDMQPSLHLLHESNLLTALRGKHGTVRTEWAAQAGATRNIASPTPGGRKRGGLGSISESPDALIPADPDNKLANQGQISTSINLLQIFIKSIEGKHFCLRLSKGMSVHELKKRIQEHIGIPDLYQNLIHSGYCLQDSQTLQHYGITNDSTIILNLRLCGGSSGTSSKNTSSFRDALKGKKMENKTTPPTELPGPYIVEQKPESPTLQITMPEVSDIYTDLSNTDVICRFNGFWPKSDALHQWIYSSWSPNCEIYLCPKGFFIVRFNTEQERDSIINQGPWFWGNAGLFTTPWFSDFDATTMIVSRMPVWVRLHGLPLHFWHHKALTAIGNTLGKFLKMDDERATRGIFTFARICVEVDLSEGLPDHITLNFNNAQ